MIKKTKLKKREKVAVVNIIKIKNIKKVIVVQVAVAVGV